MLSRPRATKSMAAKRLARHSGTDYALMTGGDVAPSAPMSSPASTSCSIGRPRRDSRRLLFIDEADAFLASHSGGAVAEEVRGAGRSRRAQRAPVPHGRTLPRRRPRQEPRTDRRISTPRCSHPIVDEAMEFALPCDRRRAEDGAPVFRQTHRSRRGCGRRRARAAAPRGDRHRKGGTPRRGRPGRPSSSIPRLTAPSMREVAKRAGVSGREIAKMMASVRRAVYGSAVAELSRETLFAVVARKWRSTPRERPGSRDSKTARWAFSARGASESGAGVPR